MKYGLSFVIFASALLAVVSARPGVRLSDSQRDVDFEKVGPVIVLSEIPDPLGDGFGDSLFSSVRDPFNGFLASMQNMMHRLRQQIAENVPSYSGHGSFFGIGNIPEGANTTSTTKVIDGHVVTVNETTYSDGDDTQGTVIRIRVVDIKPEDDAPAANPDTENITETVPDKEEITTPSSSTDRSVESVENFEENEIPVRLQAPDIQAV